jgi:hypothetical protein
VGNRDPSQTLLKQNNRSRGSEAMSSHALMATVAAIALSTPAWAHDPAEAPIDTEMKIIMWLENIEVSLRENTASGGHAVRAKSWQADVRAPMAALASVSPPSRR